MQELYNELTSSITEYTEDGVVHTRPPTGLMLRAARTLKNMAEVNDTNLANIRSLQSISSMDHETNARLHAVVREQAKEIEQLKLTKETDESLRTNPGQQESQQNSAGSLGDGGNEHQGSDSRSEGNIQSEDCGLGSN